MIPAKGALMAFWIGLFCVLGLGFLLSFGLMSGTDGSENY